MDRYLVIVIKSDKTRDDRIAKIYRNVVVIQVSTPDLHWYLTHSIFVSNVLFSHESQLCKTADIEPNIENAPSDLRSHGLLSRTNDDRAGLRLSNKNISRVNETLESGRFMKLKGHGKFLRGFNVMASFEEEILGSSALPADSWQE
ncbi:hypothetical protein OIU85_025956 [Salix viminalis]|uniref:Uncharacterized protein n=1 Tax=Salix viminalis TaxID=40686 RepID=A0A9Q0YYA9_SALVM|nr:hypothetical protein OIU85_025956 [Salix viminalis]